MHDKPSGAQTSVKLLGLLESLENFRLLDPQMPIQRALVFLTIAAHDGITISEISERLDLSNSTVNRNVRDLGATGRRGSPGHGLVESVPDPELTKRYVCQLTPKGRRWLYSIVRHL